MRQHVNVYKAGSIVLYLHVMLQTNGSNSLSPQSVFPRLFTPHSSLASIIACLLFSHPPSLPPSSPACNFSPMLLFRAILPLLCQVHSHSLLVS